MTGVAVGDEVCAVGVGVARYAVLEYYAASPPTAPGAASARRAGRCVCGTRRWTGSNRATASRADPAWRQALATGGARGNLPAL
jgi:hypothetical protein